MKQDGRSRLRALKLGVFASSLPLAVGRRLGFFADQGLEVCVERVRSSRQQMSALADGSYDVVQTSPDNLAAYRVNGTNPLGRRLAVTAFLAADSGMNLVLVGAPGVTDVDVVRHRVLAVDSAHSGFAFVAYALLERHGMFRDRDYTVHEVGGVAARAEHLLNGHCSLTLLSNGFELQAVRRGCTVLDEVGSVARPYLGTVFSCLSAWLEQHPDIATAVTVAYLDAVAWSLDPAHREQAVELLASELGVTSQVAAGLYSPYVDPRHGLVADGMVGQAALRSVLDLRARYGGFDTSEGPVDLDLLSRPGILYDLTTSVRAHRKRSSRSVTTTR